VKNLTCFNSRELTIQINAVDSGSGVASITYSATGAQPSASTTVQSSSVQLSFMLTGGTTLTYTATDAAGNTAADKREAVISTSLDPTTRAFYSCAAPEPASILRVDDRSAVHSVPVAALSGASYLPILSTGVDAHCLQ
jgi:hypothetical protein